MLLFTPNNVSKSNPLCWILGRFKSWWSDNYGQHFLVDMLFKNTRGHLWLFLKSFLCTWTILNSAYMFPLCISVLNGPRRRPAQNLLSLYFMLNQIIWWVYLCYRSGLTVDEELEYQMSRWVGLKISLMVTEGVAMESGSRHCNDSRPTDQISQQSVQPAMTI